MAYTKQTWTNDPSKTSSGLNGPGYEVNAEKLNHMEDGIEAANLGGGGTGGTPVNDANLVHKTGDETIAGIKTFSVAPVVPANAWATQFSTNAATYLPANNYHPIVVLEAGASIPTGLDVGTIVFQKTTGGGGGPLTVTQLTGAGSTTDGTTFTTASITPAAGALHLAFVTTGMTSTTGTAAPLAANAVTGAGLTWTRAFDIASAAGGTSVAGMTRSSLYVGTGTGSTGALTIAPGGTVEGISWKIVDIANANTTIVQGATANPSATSTSPGLTLTGVNAANAVLGFIAQQNSNALTPATGFTSIGAQQDITTPSLTIAAEYKLTGQNSVTFTGSGTVQRNVIAIEVAPA